MKQPQLTPLLLSATLFLAATAAGAAETTAATPAPEPARGPHHAEMLKRFDKNNDGKIDETERAAIREARQEMRREGDRAWRGPEGRQKGPKPGPWGMQDPAFRRGYLLGKFDVNNDGKLDDTEKAAIREAADKRIRAGVEKHLQRLRAIDTDNDGKISDPEWAAAREKFKAEHPRMDKPDDDLPPPPPPGAGGGNDDDDGNDEAEAAS
jgi:hypothetical protein